jgi:hypothetical protein
MQVAVNMKKRSIFSVMGISSFAGHVRTLSFLWILLLYHISCLAQGPTNDSLDIAFSRHHVGIQLTSLLNPVVPAVQFQYLLRTNSKQAWKIEAGYLFSPFLVKDETRRGFRAELSYIKFVEEYRMWGITMGGRYALHTGNNVDLERFGATLVNIVSRDGIEMRSRLGGVWYMMGGQFIHNERWYSQIEFLLGLVVFERIGLNVPAGERLFRGDSFQDFTQPNEFRARVLPSIRIYYSWGRRSAEKPMVP